MSIMCKIFGHKYETKMVKITPDDYKYTVKTSRNICIRCGMDEWDVLTKNSIHVNEDDLDGTIPPHSTVIVNGPLIKIRR